MYNHNPLQAFYLSHFGTAQNVFDKCRSELANFAETLGFNGQELVKHLDLPSYGEEKFDGGKYKFAANSKDHGRCAVWIRTESLDGIQYPFITLKFKGDSHTFSGFNTIKDAYQEHKAEKTGAPKPYKPSQPVKAKKVRRGGTWENRAQWRIKQNAISINQSYEVAKPENGQSDYYIKKGIQGVAAAENATIARRMADRFGEFTAIPMQSYVFEGDSVAHNPLVGYQRLYLNGDKKQTEAVIDGVFKGAFQYIGRQPINSECCTILYAEGYATAASGYLATGYTSVFAVSSSNIVNVIKAHLAKYPNARHVMLADNDHVKQAEGKGNAGLIAAYKLLKEHAGKLTVVYPQLDAVDPQFKDKVTDFNDIQQFTTLGQKAVKRQIESQSARFVLGENAFIQACQWLSILARPQAEKFIFKAVAAAVAVGPAKYNLQDVVTYIRLAAAKCGAVVCAEKIARFYQRLLSERIGKAHALRSFTEATTENPLLTFRRFNKTVLDEEVFNYIVAMPKKAVVVVRAPMGSGKTNNIIRGLINRVDHAIYTCHRRSLTAGVASQLAIQHYVEDKSDMAQGMIDKVAICVNSITQDHFTKHIKYDLQDLYIDEASQVLSHICSGGAIDKPLNVWRQLKYAIAEASGKTVLLDADANDLTVKFALQAAQDAPVFVIDLNADCSDFSVLHGNQAQVFKSAVDAAEQQNVLFATDSKPKAEQVYQRWCSLYPKRKFLLITTDTTGNPEVLAFFDNPTLEARKYHGISFSPCISSGVSMQADISKGETPHFQRHFGLFNGQVPPNEAVQMLRRDRDARLFEIGLSTQGNHYEDRREILLETIRNNLHKSGILTAEEITLSVDWDNPNLPMTSISPDADFELMAVELTALVNAARNDFANNFVCQLMADNYNVSRLAEDEEADKAGRAEVAIAKEAIDARIIDLHESVSTATEEEAALLTQKAMHQGITEEERAKLNRYMLVNKLFVPVTPENILWLNRDAWQHVSNFELLHAPVERLHAYVQAQIGAGKGLINVKQAVRKQSALHYIFDRLEVNLRTGTGTFNTEAAAGLLKELQSTKGTAEVMQSLGLKVSGVKCAGSWIKGTFKKLGLKLDSNRVTINGRKTTIYTVNQETSVSDSGRLTPGWKMLESIYRQRCAANLSSFDSKELAIAAEDQGHDPAMDLYKESQIASGENTVKTVVIQAVEAVGGFIERLGMGSTIFKHARTESAAVAALADMLNPRKALSDLAPADKVAMYDYIARVYPNTGAIAAYYQADYDILRLVSEYAPSAKVAKNKLPELFASEAPQSIKESVFSQVKNLFRRELGDIEIAHLNGLLA